MRRSSSLLSRLALALLAVMGFVAPLATVEADRVVQTDGAKPSPVHEQAGPALAAAVPQAATAAAPGRFTSREASTSRRYLLHRAWLI